MVSIPSSVKESALDTLEPSFDPAGCHRDLLSGNRGYCGIYSIRNIHTHKLLRGEGVAFPHHGGVSLWSHELRSSVSFAYLHGVGFRHACTAQDRLFSAYPGLIWVTRFIMTKRNYLIGQRGVAPHERGPSGRGIALRQLWTSRRQRAGGQKTC